MEKLELSECVFEELSPASQAEVYGGSWVKFITEVFWSAVENFGDIREGFQDGYKGTPRY